MTQKIECMEIGEGGEYINDYVGWSNALRLRVTRLSIEPPVASAFLASLGRKCDDMVNKGFVCVSRDSLDWLRSGEAVGRNCFVYLHDGGWWLYIVEPK